MPFLIRMCYESCNCLQKISKKFHLSKSRLSALNESGQLVVFHLVTLLWGGDAILREGFIFNIPQLWDGKI